METDTENLAEDIVDEVEKETGSLEFPYNVRRALKQTIEEKVAAYVTESQASYDNGYSNGHSEGYDEGFDEGFDEGYEKAKKEFKKDDK